MAVFVVFAAGFALALDALAVAAFGTALAFGVAGFAAVFGFSLGFSFGVALALVVVVVFAFFVEASFTLALSSAFLLTPTAFVSGTLVSFRTFLASLFFFRPLFLQLALQFSDMRRHRQLPILAGIQQPHSAHGLGLGWLEAIVDKLCLEPVGGMISVATRREVFLDLGDSCAAVLVLAGRVSEEISVDKGKPVLGYWRGSLLGGGSGFVGRHLLRLGDWTQRTRANVASDICVRSLLCVIWLPRNSSVVLLLFYVPKLAVQNFPIWLGSKY